MDSAIVILDPALANHQGDISNNLGDLIISESVTQILLHLFPNDEIIKISTHDFLENKHIRIINQSKFTFIGGSNLLSSDIKSYNQWKVTNNYWHYYFPQIKNLILFGVGWWQYQNKPSFTTKRFYNSILSRDLFHSVRDSYTLEKMKQLGIQNSLNTSCITTWGLDKMNVNKKRLKVQNCLFTLTDYNQDPNLDNKLVTLLSENYDGFLFFFPQGKYDEDYLKSLDSYKKNINKIKILNRSNTSFNEMLNGQIDYIGTRLHGGIMCLQNSIDTLIIAVDNRALEMSYDISLPVVKRADFESILAWIQGTELFEPINLPLESIIKWKSQFQ